MTENKTRGRVSIYDLEEEEERRKSPEPEENFAPKADPETEAVIDRVLKKLDDSYYVDENKHRDFWMKLDELSASDEDDDSLAGRRRRRKQQRAERKQAKEARIEALARVELLRLSQSKGVELDPSDYAAAQAAEPDTMPAGRSYSFSDGSDAESADADSVGTAQTDAEIPPADQLTTEDETVSPPPEQADHEDITDEPQKKLEESAPDFAQAVVNAADGGADPDEDDSSSTIPVIEYGVEDYEPDFSLIIGRNAALLTSEQQLDNDIAQTEDAEESADIEQTEYADENDEADEFVEPIYSTQLIQPVMPENGGVRTISWTQYLHSMEASRGSLVEAAGDRSAQAPRPERGLPAQSSQKADEHMTERLKKAARRRAKRALKKESAAQKRADRRARSASVRDSIKGLPKGAKALLTVILIVVIAASIASGIFIRTEFIVISEIVEQRNESSKRYQALMDEMTATQLDLDSLTADAEQLQLEIASYQELIALAQEYQVNKENYEAEIEELRAQLSDVENTVKDRQSKLDEVTAALKLYEQELAAAKGKGYKLSAGVYFVDEDIPHGYYNIDLVSGNGNVYVKSSDGTVVVGELFGTRSDIYISSYKNAYLEPDGYIEVTGSAVVTFTARDEEGEY